MSDDSLNRALKDLHAELERISAGGELDEERLLPLVSDVEDRLEQEREEEPGEGVLAGLRHWAERFELEHPRAAALVNRIMVSLGNTGI